MKIIKVVCGLIFDNTTVLVCRKSANKSLAGFWEFPGGKVEITETPENALTRELMEELGMTVSVGKHFKTVMHDYEDFIIEMSAYYCQFLSATYKLVDHDTYEWVKPENLHKLKLAPADIPIAIALQSYLKH